MIADIINVQSLIPNIGTGNTLNTMAEGPALRRALNIDEESRNAFDQFLQAAMDVVNETNVRLIDSDVAQMRFATGQDNDMLNVVLAQDRASSALNFTVQVSNRIIEAYREIMRMQV